MIATSVPIVQLFGIAGELIQLAFRLSGFVSQFPSTPLAALRLGAVKYVAEQSFETGNGSRQLSTPRHLVASLQQARLCAPLQASKPCLDLRHANRIPLVQATADV